MTGCNTGRNIQKYKGAGASTLQDVTDNSNTTTGDIITTSGFFIGDGSKLTGVALSTDLASNSSRISTVSTNLVSNVSRIDDLETEVRPANRGGTGINSYTVGDILYASATDTLSNLPIGTSGEFLKTNGTTILWSTISEVAPATTGTLTANTFQYLTSNNGTFNGSADVTFGVDATTTNTTNKIVARDSNGNVYATEYHGDYLKHTSDTNTHLGFPSNDTFTVTTGGTERLRIDNSGNVGIGESTPTTPLHIECADTSTHYQNGLLVKQSSSSHPAIIGIRTSSTSQDPFISFMVNSDSTGWSYGVDASGSNKMKWAYTPSDISSSTRMTLTNDGKLGIGESTPTAPLHIECADTSTQYENGLLVKQTNSSHPAIIGIRTSSTTQDPFISFMVNSDSTGWSYGVDASESNKMKWAYNPSDVSSSTIMTLTNDGKLGIGESTPITPLHIECADTSTHYQNGLLVKQSHSSHPAIIGIRTSSTTQDPFISFMVNSDTTGWSYGVDASESNKMKWAYTTTDVSNSTRMTLTNDGKLGIGTTSPGYNLDVDGTMKLTGGLFVNSSYGTIGQVLTSGGGSGNMSWTTVSSGGSSPWTVSGSDIYRSSGKVGIETTTPAYTLDVDGDIRTTSEGGFRGNGRNITGINITSERNQTIINFGQQSSLKKSVNGNPL
jgi:hypothetical protein